MIAVTFQHPCPFYDDSHAMNSPNLGPYGDAVMQELIPYIEENFRAVQEAQGLDFQDIYMLARNAFQASFLNPIEKQKYLDELDEFVFGFSVH